MIDVLNAKERAVLEAVGEDRRGYDLYTIVMRLEEAGFPKYNDGLVWTILARLVRWNLVWRTSKTVTSRDGRERVIGIYSRFSEPA